VCLYREDVTVCLTQDKPPNTAYQGNLTRESHRKMMARMRFLGIPHASNVTLHLSTLSEAVQLNTQDHTIHLLNILGSL